MMPEEQLGERSLTEEVDDEVDEGQTFEADRIAKADLAKRQYIEEKEKSAEELGKRTKREEKLEEKSSTLTLTPNPAAVPQLEPAMKCRACGANNSPSALACLTCFAATNETSWKEEIEQVLSELLGAMLIVRKWGDRGARTAKSDQRRRFKRYLKRAHQLGFNSVADRFFNDYTFRSNMIDGGWDEFTISMIDDGAIAQRAEPKGRSREQRGRAEGYFHGHAAGAEAMQFPQGALDRPEDLRVANARRREEYARWRRTNEQGEEQSRDGWWSSSSSSWWNQQGSWWSR
jgi:hypothetical protein